MGVSPHHDAIPTPLMTNTVRIRRGGSAAKDEVGLKRAAAPAVSAVRVPSGVHQQPGTWAARCLSLGITTAPSSAARGCRMAMGSRDIPPFIAVTAPLVHLQVSCHSPAPC
jgi:hypothetical protein